MAEVTSGLVKELREKTGAGMMDCKKALQESGADLEKAVDWLRKKGLATAQKKAGRSATEGAVGSYIHMGGKVGVLVEVNCETDFTARNEKFQALVKDIAMQIAWSNPRWLRREDVPANVIAEEKNIHRAQHLKKTGLVRSFGRGVIDMLAGIYERGVKAGVFRAGVSALDLHMTISALSFFNVANRATFSLIFDHDMADPGVMLERRDQVVETVLRKRARARGQPR